MAAAVAQEEELELHSFNLPFRIGTFVEEFWINLFYPLSLGWVILRFGYSGAQNRSFLPLDQRTMFQIGLALLHWSIITLPILNPKLITEVLSVDLIKFSVCRTTLTQSSYVLLLVTRLSMISLKYAMRCDSLHVRHRTVVVDEWSLMAEQVLTGWAKLSPRLVAHHVRAACVRDNLNDQQLLTFPNYDPETLRRVFRGALDLNPTYTLTPVPTGGTFVPIHLFVTQLVLDHPLPARNLHGQKLLLAALLAVAPCFARAMSGLPVAGGTTISTIIVVLTAMNATFIVWIFHMSYLHATVASYQRMRVWLAVLGRVGFVQPDPHSDGKCISDCLRAQVTGHPLSRAQPAPAAALTAAADATTDPPTGEAMVPPLDSAAAACVSVDASSSPSELRVRDLRLPLHLPSNVMPWVQMHDWLAEIGHRFRIRMEVFLAIFLLSIAVFGSFIAYSVFTRHPVNPAGAALCACYTLLMLYAFLGVFTHGIAANRQFHYHRELLSHGLMSISACQVASGPRVSPIASALTAGCAALRRMAETRALSIAGALPITAATLQVLIGGTLAVAGALFQQLTTDP